MTFISLIVLTVSFGCSKTEPPPNTQRSAATSTPTEVTVWFRGLMVFHPENGKPTYEVGILAENHHDFSVGYPGMTIPKPLPTGPSWTLQITNSTSAPTIPPIENGHTGRRPDSAVGQNDFSWIIDFDKDFHAGTTLNLQPGHLKPIIHLPKGKFFTQYKSMDLQRKQGPGTFSDFGFVPETIGLQLELQQGQELVLKDESSGAEVFRLPYQPPLPSPYIVWINNVRHPATEASDFGMYYDLLFPDIPQDQRYDFRRNTSANQMYPYNPDPTWTVRTCCQMACTALLLSQRKDALQ
jgi:hypothetical protein